DLMEYWVQPDGMYVNIAPYNVASYAAGQQQAIVTPEILTAVQNGTTEDEMITVINGLQAPASDFILPYSSVRSITDDDLKKLEGASVEEEHYRSQLAINEILARYGYVFHPENGGASKEAYDQFQGKSWYEQAKAYCPSESANEMLYTYLSNIELANVNRICEWQKVHNCYY
ncbi:MAG: YARHG domain-containing protein, partial [Lachnospiraceae bacterium]|nr:YARHG domain-containing protein [Lachnospiraceae bacterium]